MRLQFLQQISFEEHDTLFFCCKVVPQAQTLLPVVAHEFEFSVLLIKNYHLEELRSKMLLNANTTRANTAQPPLLYTC